MDYLSHMEGRSPEQRIQEIFQLMVKDELHSVSLIQEGLLVDQSPIVRHECAYSLGEMNSDGVHQSLVNTINHDTNKFVVHEAALALANLGEKASMVVLRSLLKHENRDVVLTAEIAIERLRMKISDETVLDSGFTSGSLILQGDAHPEHRIQAAFLLLDEGSETSIKVLVQALYKEEDPIVKHEIIFSLGESASSYAITPLIEEMKNDPNIFVKHEAALALATLGQPLAAVPIRSLLHHDDPDIVESAEIALERLNL